MFSKITNYFIPSTVNSEELLRQYRLNVQIILITTCFNLSYAGLTVLMDMKRGTYAMLLAFIGHGILSFFIKKGAPLKLITNIYLFIGAQAVFQCTFFSGGFDSPVLPWFAASPIIALLMGGRRIGMVWLIINIVLVLFYGIMDLLQYSFPSDYNHAWESNFSIQCYTGLVLIIFAVSLVFEDGKNTALKKLAEQNILLAEEKKKFAMQEISQEIHDNIGQTLSLAKLNLHSLQKVSEERAKNKIDDTVGLVSKAIKDLREISNNLHSDNIVDFNIVETIRNELSMISKIGNYKINMDVSGNYQRLSAQTEFILYRIYQEVLSNIIKHSKASNIQIEITYSETQLSVKIKDDGIGINCEDVLLNGQGLRNIRSRVKLIGGEVHYDSSTNKGTLVHICLPFGIESFKAVLN